jgi:hypothetical protein
MAVLSDPSGGGVATPTGLGVPSTGPGVSLVLTRSDATTPETFTFPVGAEQQVLEIPDRATLYFAQGGFYLFSLGKGQETLTLAGTTGLRTTQPGLQTAIRGVSAQDLVQTPGYQAYFSLKELIERYHGAYKDGATAVLLLAFNNPTGMGVFQVHPGRARFFRANNRPVLIQFELDCQVLADLLQGEGATSSALGALQQASDVQARQDAQQAADAVGPSYVATWTTGANDSFNSIAQTLNGAPGLAVSAEAIAHANVSATHVTALSATLPPGVVLRLPTTERQP